MLETDWNHVYLGKFNPLTYYHIDVINRIRAVSKAPPEIWFTTKFANLTVEEKRLMIIEHADTVGVFVHQCDHMFDMVEQMVARDRHRPTVFWCGEDRVRDLLRAARYYTNGTGLEAVVSIIPRDAESGSATKAREAAAENDLDKYARITPCVELFSKYTPGN